MSRLIWFVLRRFYLLGLLFVVPTFIISIAGGVFEEPDLGIVIVTGSLLYFMLGYIWLIWIPKRLNARLLERIRANKSVNFNPLAHATALLYNRAIAIDPQRRKLLYIDMQNGSEEILAYEAIRDWELVQHGTGPASLTLATDSPSHPTIGLNLAQSQADNFSGWLRTIK